MALGGASAKPSPAGMKRKAGDEPTSKGKAKKDESSESSRFSSAAHISCSCLCLTDAPLRLAGRVCECAGP